MGPVAVSGGALAGMRPIATPIAASGFGPRALSLLESQFKPLGMAPMAGGAASKKVIEDEGDKPLVPGAPLSVAMVTGDFDLSGIGTVTHVEGDRVYGFGHPMMGLGACDLPMMTGYIHTVYPRASVSMKMGSPLKVVGILDTDVSTGIAGRIGGKPDMLPMSVRVKTSRFSDPKTYHVQVIREPNMMATLAMVVLTNAIDTEGNLPDELTAKIAATIRIKGYDPIEVRDTLSGPRFTGPMGPSTLFLPDRVDYQHRGEESADARADRVDRLRGRSRPGPLGRDDRIGPAGDRPRRAGRKPSGVRDAQASQGRAQGDSDHAPPRGGPRARHLRFDDLRLDEQPAAAGPQRARAVRTARPQRLARRVAPATCAEAHGALRTCSAAGAWTFGRGAVAASVARHGAGRLRQRTQHRRTRASVGSRNVGRHALGRRGKPVVAVHGGQRRRLVAKVTY